MALSADDVARYRAEGYLLPEVPMRAMSAEEAQAVRRELEELEKRVGVTANKVRTSVHPTVHVLRGHVNVCARAAFAFTTACPCATSCMN
jgi:NAD/NADP transhydrogenase beta subunit